MTRSRFGTRFCLSFVLCLTAKAAHAQQLHVLIDPGHGGKDRGATRGQLKESDIALKVAHQLADQLRRDPNFKVTLTRTSNETLSLNRRTEIAGETKADLFLSIHLNSSNDPRAQGKEFYFQNQLPADEEALFLASRENAETEDDAPVEKKQSEKVSASGDLKRILEDLNRNYRIHASSELSKILNETWVSGGNRQHGSRAIRQAPFHVVSNVSVPSVLVELGFISHAQEGPRLAQASYQQELAKSLYDGLVKYKETVDKGRGANLSSPDAN